MVVLKGREGKPSYICDWKTGAGKLEADLRSIYRTLGPQGNFAHVYFLFSIVGPQDKPKSATFKLHMAGEGAVISSLPVIRTEQRQRQEGVPLACLVVDEQARKLGEGTVVVRATVNGKTYEMKETGGIWRTRVHDLPDGLKDVRPIVMPGGQTHYSWSRDGRTFLAYLPGQIPGSTIKLQGFPEGPLSCRLYDLDKKDVVATGRFQKSIALTLPEKGNSFFLLVTS